jgi:hypothetical protein
MKNNPIFQNQKEYRAFFTSLACSFQKVKRKKSLINKKKFEQKPTNLNVR